MACETLIPNYGYITLSQASLSVTLKAPKLGNKNTYTFNRIDSRTRGNDLILFADSRWPKQDEITYEFEALSLEKIEELRNFIQQTVGLAIDILDFEGVTKTGIITSPELEVIQEGRGNCNFATSFNFQNYPGITLD